MVVVGHQAIGIDIQDIVDEVMAKPSEEEEIVFVFDEDPLVVVASVVEVVVLSW